MTLGAELASGILSREQNKIRTELMQRKLVRKGYVFNLPAKRNISQMSDSNSPSSVEDEETRATSGAELASGILSHEQNKIRTKLRQRKLVRKGHVFNLPAKRNISQMSDSNSPSSAEDKETRATSGAELASDILSGE